MLLRERESNLTNSCLFYPTNARALRGETQTPNHASFLLMLYRWFAEVQAFVAWVLPCDAIATSVLCLCLSVCLSVCLSQFRVLARRLNIRSRKQRHTKAMDFSFLESIGAFCASVVYWNNCLEHIHTLKIIYSKINVILIIFGTSYSEDMIRYFAMQCICLPVQILALKETANR